MASSEAFEFGTNMLVLAKDTSFSIFDITVKPVLSGPWKIDKTKVSKTGGTYTCSLVQVESMQNAFCNTFDLYLINYRSWRHILGPSYEWLLKTGFTVYAHCTQFYHNVQAGLWVSEDSNQSLPLHSLIRVLVFCLKKRWTLDYPLSAHQRLWHLNGRTCQLVVLCWAPAHFEPKRSIKYSVCAYKSMFFVCLIWFFYVPSTIFQL